MSVPEGATVYLNTIRGQLSRLLSLEDREPFSKTYGCFDRTYWGWKFTDFPGARLQEGVYALAYLYHRLFQGNPLAGKEQALVWARAGLDFWRRIQYPDGSFDEAYPFEHSLAATAFTGFYVGEAFLILTEHIPEDEQAKLRDAFVRAGDWLCRHDEHHGILSNHLAAAAAALYVIYRITGESKYEQRTRYFLERIYACQSHEGWYEEYGGADPGYQTHTTLYLARLWQYTQDEELLESLQRSLAFLKHFIHPNGTLGGEYGSRNTEFYFPAGFEMLATVCSDAALIARFMRTSVAEQVGAGLAAMDIYNFLPMFNNYLFAAEHAVDLDSVEGMLPCQQEGDWQFSDAGLLVRSMPAHYAIMGLSKGGVLRVYERSTGKLIVSDCGYWAQLSDGRVVSNQNLKRPAYWRQQGNGLIIEADFVQINQRILCPWLFVLFRLFSLTLGRLQTVAYWLKKLLVVVLVKRRRPAPLRLIRQVRFAVDTISVSDQIELTGNVEVRMLQADTKFATTHMGSSRYFQRQELDAKPIKAKDQAGELMHAKVLCIRRIWHL